MAADFVWLNPHLSLSCSWDGELHVKAGALDPGWGERKWRPSDPTSAHWYDGDRFARYMAAHIARDRDHGVDRTVRDFISELRGLTGSVKQKAVLAESGASRTLLSAFFAEGKNEAGVAQLLGACQKHTKPVKSADLGFDCPVHHHLQGRKWFALPGKPIIDDQGRQRRDGNRKFRITPLAERRERATSDRFSEIGIGLLREKYADALSDEEPER